MGDPDKPAPEAPADLKLENDPLWQQAKAQLERIGIVVEDLSAQAWSEAECTEAAFWVKLVQEKGAKAPACPKFIAPRTILRNNVRSVSASLSCG